MSNLNLVTLAGIRRNLRMKTTLILLIVITLIIIAAVAAIFCMQFIGPELNSQAPSRSVLAESLSLILYITNIVGVGVTLNSFGFQTMVREKERGNLQSLLATPLKDTDIWLGKSLAVFLPGLVLATVLTGLALIIINAIYFIPETGFLITPHIVINGFVVAPFIYLFLVPLVHLVGYTDTPMTGNVIAQVFLPVITTLMINLTLRNVVEINSWLFAGINIGIAVIIGILVFSLRSQLTPERIILSGG